MCCKQNYADNSLHEAGNVKTLCKKTILKLNSLNTLEKFPLVCKFVGGQRGLGGCQLINLQTDLIHHQRNILLYFKIVEAKEDNAQ